MPLQETAQALLADKRLILGPLNGGLLAIGCGFPHCVADAFFYLCAPMDFWAVHLGEILMFYAAIVAGNFVGCNAYRWIAGSNPE